MFNSKFRAFGFGLPNASATKFVLVVFQEKKNQPVKIQFGGWKQIDTLGNYVN